MKKYKFYFISVIVIFGFSALLYFIDKSIISNYNLIGSPLDTKIPLIPEFIYFYMIWYPFEITTLYFLFKHDKDNYIKVVLALVLSLIIAHIIFWTYPTMVDRPIVDTYNNLTSFMVYFTYATDTPDTCLPSVHCLICFVVLFGTIGNKGLSNKYKYIIYFVNTMIILSTLFVKQHVLYDVFASLIISVLCYYLFTKSKPFNKIKTKLEAHI